MIFEELGAALKNINAWGNYNFDSLVSHFDIDLQYTEDLPDGIKGYTLPITRTIFINPHCDNFYMTGYHELTHCLVDNSAEPLIESSYMINSRVEGRADTGALYLMLKDYLSISEIELSDFSISHFMYSYNIPNKYFYYIFKYFND